MSPITIPLHLFIPTVVSLAGLIFLFLKRNNLRRKYPALYKSALIFLFSYALIVCNALGHDIYYQWDLNRYDLNQDGLFGSPTETTLEQERAMERLINDVGRNFSPISGLIFSTILSLSFYVMMRISNALFGPEDKEDNMNQIHTTHT